MESAINYVRALVDSGRTPSAIRVNDPWQTALLQSDIFTGDTPLLDPAIVTDAITAEEHLIVFVDVDHGEHRAVLSE